MGLETGSHIPELDDTNPTGADPKSQGDDHLRLLKRCTKGSFPAFVGTDAVPKSVALTEDQINDAALQSEVADIVAAWLFSASPTLANAIPMLGRNVADTDSAELVELNAADLVLLGSNLFEGRLQALTTLLVRIGGSNEAQFVTRALGALLIKDMLGTDKKAGFRNPGRKLLSVDYSVVQDDEGSILQVQAANVAITLEALEEFTTLRIITSNFDGTTLIQGAGMSVRHYNGSGAAVNPGANPFQIGGGSVVEIYYQTTTGVAIFGNGISV